MRRDETSLILTLKDNSFIDPRIDRIFGNEKYIKFLLFPEKPFLFLI